MAPDTGLPSSSTDVTTNSKLADHSAQVVSPETDIILLFPVIMKTELYWSLVQSTQGLPSVHRRATDEGHCLKVNSQEYKLLTQYHGRFRDIDDQA